MGRSSQKPLISLIGSASGWGAQNRDTEHGPDYLKKLGLNERLNQKHFESHWSSILHPMAHSKDLSLANGEATLPYLVPHLAALAERVEQDLISGYFPVVVGGDHAMAIGTFSGATQALQAHGKMGLIWIDAHLDANTPETSPSQAFHGMPVACLLGYGRKELTALGGAKPKVNPHNVVLIGVRSFESGEMALLQKLGVKVFYQTDVVRLGFEQVLQEALSIATEGTQCFGVSIDLDAFDPTIAPGVGSPAPDGLTASEVLPQLHRIAENPNFRLLEISEYNPLLDQQNRTAYLIMDILENILPRSCP